MPPSLQLHTAQVCSISNVWLASTSIMHFSTLVQFEDFLSISPFLSISRKSENTICPPCCFASEISVTHTSLLKCQVSLFWCLESRLLTPWCVQEIRTHCSIYCICVVWTFKRLDVAKSDFDAMIGLGRRKRGTLPFFGSNAGRKSAE